MVHIPLTFLSGWREFPSAPCLAKKNTLWQLASPCCWNRARCLTCFLWDSVTRKDNSAHEHTPLSNDTIDSILRHREIDRTKDVISIPSYVLTYLLTPWSSVLEKLTGFQLVKKLPAFYGTRSLITTFTSPRHLSLSWANSILSIPPHSTSWRSILILSSHLCLALPSAFYPSGFPTKSLYTLLLSTLRAAYSTYLIPLDLSPEQYWVMSTDN